MASEMENMVVKSGARELELGHARISFGTGERIYMGLRKALAHSRSEIGEEIARNGQVTRCLIW